MAARDDLKIRCSGVVSVTLLQACCLDIILWDCWQNYRWFQASFCVRDSIGLASRAPWRLGKDQPERQGTIKKKYIFYNTLLTFQGLSHKHQLSASSRSQACLTSANHVRARAPRPVSQAPLICELSLPGLSPKCQSCAGSRSQACPPSAN